MLLAKVKQKSGLQIFIGVQEGLQIFFEKKIYMNKKKIAEKWHFSGF